MRAPPVRHTNEPTAVATIQSRVWTARARAHLMRHNSRQLESHKRKALPVVGGDARVVGHPVVRRGIHLCLEFTEDRLVRISRLRRKIVLIDLVVLLAALRANALLAKMESKKTPFTRRNAHRCFTVTFSLCFHPCNAHGISTPSFFHAFRRDGDQKKTSRRSYRSATV